MNEIPNCPAIDGCPCNVPGICVCGTSERALRAWMKGTLPPMTIDQILWCLKEIDSVEGHSDDDHLKDTDAELARGVINAWTDYCRDKGLI